MLEEQTSSTAYAMGMKLHIMLSSWTVNVPDTIFKPSDQHIPQLCAFELYVKVVIGYH